MSIATCALRQALMVCLLLPGLIACVAQPVTPVAVTPARDELTIGPTATLLSPSMPSTGVNPTAEPTAPLSAVDATQVANATATARAAPLKADTPTALTPAPLPTTTDGRSPRIQADGFTISVVANTADYPILHPTALTWGPDGAMYVARQEGPVVRIAPDGSRTIFAEFPVPLGLAFRPGTTELYVSHRGGISVVEDQDGNGIAESQREFITGMACCYAELHQTNGLQFGPDGWLYFGQGANSDHGEVPPVAWHASILRVNPERGPESLETVATGVRNSFDLAVRRDGAIFATDNGADFGPPEELNHIIPGADYGWPDCYSVEAGVTDVDPSYPDSTRCPGTRAAIATFVPHASANGVVAYEASQFPPVYRGNLFVALWSHIEGAYRIVYVELTPQGDTFQATYTPFVTDFELPLAVEVGPDGALYIADWGPGRIYRVAYGE